MGGYWVDPDLNTGTTPYLNLIRKRGGLNEAEVLDCQHFPSSPGSADAPSPVRVASQPSLCSDLEMINKLPAIETIPLHFLRNGKRMFHGRCRQCGCDQPVYPKELIREHGPGATLAEASTWIACMFCHKMGLEIIER